MNRLPFLASLAAFCFAALVFVGSIWATFAPHEFDRRVEWVQYKLLALLPESPHPEFVPTPIQKAQLDAPIPSITPAPEPILPRATLSPTRTPIPQPTRKSPPPSPQPTSPLPPRVTLANFKHDYQRFNNCGPATLAIMLSHLGRGETQYDLAPVLKGNKDDRNVSPEELAALAQTYGLRVTVRVNGQVAELKRLIAQGFPVMVETWFVPRPKDASGHYRLLIGYDDAGTASTRAAGLSVAQSADYPATETGFFIAQDSYIGPNTKLPYQAFDQDWRVFNRTFLVIHTDAQAASVRAILGGGDAAAMFARSRERAQAEAAQNDKDAFAWFNLGSSLVGLQEYESAARAFDKARMLKLPWRMLWYQFGPYEAYYRTGRYTELIALADATLASAPGLEESLYYRGLAQLALGQKSAARDSFQRALQANPLFARAKEALVRD